MNAEKDPLEGLSADALTDISSYEHPFDERRTERIAELFTRKTAAVQHERQKEAATQQARYGATRRRKHESQATETHHRKPRRLVALLAAAAIVVLAGFTYADRIQELFTTYFGGGTEVAQQAQTIKKSVTDQGIRFEAVSAINDGETTYLIVDLQDTTDDRLSGYFEVEGWNLPIEGAWGLGWEPLSYDAETRTATLMADITGASSGETVELSFSKLYTDKSVVDTTATDVDLAELLGQGGTFESIDWVSEGGQGGSVSLEFLADGRDFSAIDEVLARDEMHVDILGLDTGYLSNIAYRDGFLHVQMNPSDTVNVEGESAQLFNLVDIRTGEEVDEYYGVVYGEHSNGTITYVGGDYDERVFRVAEADLPYLKLHVYGHRYDTLISGDWKVSFTVPERTEVLTAETSAPLPDLGEGFVVTEVKASPLSVILSFNYESANDPYDIHADVRLVYRDGTKTAMSGSVGGGSSLDEDAKEGTITLIGPIENFADLVRVEIEGTSVDLRGEAA